MSKSLGNYISPDDIIEKYGAEAFRYYFLRHIPSYNDGDFSWKNFEAAYNNELANELGNAVQRTVAMIKQYQEGVIGDIPPANHGWPDPLPRRCIRSPGPRRVHEEDIGIPLHLLAESLVEGVAVCECRH